MGRTTIIISELTKQQTLSIPAIVKSEIAQFKAAHNIDKDIIQHWTELPGLSRLVIVPYSPEIALEIFQLLKAQHKDIKIHLSESILPRHKSFDRSLNVATPLSPEPELYEEPKPVYQEEAHINDRRKRVLLESLSLDTTEFFKKPNFIGTISPVSPVITLEEFDH